MKSFLRPFTFFLVIAACTPKEKATPALADELDAHFSGQYPKNEPGAAVLILKGDSVVFSKGYGVADLKTQEAITPKTLFNLGSISKTFVASAILILQEQGKLSVEDSLFKYFPAFKNKSIAQRVKIKHLLTHTSGLGDNRRVGSDTVFYLTARDVENWYPETQLDSLSFEPGAQFEYSNPAFNGLALIVEQVSGMPWQTFVKENIFNPAGMTTSTITNGAHPEQGVSHAYVLNHGQWTEDDYGEEPTFPAAGNGGVWSSVEEMALYEQAFRAAKFLKPETIREARTIKTYPHWKSAEKPFIGWPWFIANNDSITLVGHPGSQGGFLTNYVSIPEKKILFVILCNAPREDYEMKETTAYVLRQLKARNWLD
ncbi:serine hydrolase domain-containing protein [Chryseolinea lacunae]|uniref:Serine hydrolase n=1 Tax=Chryseolinea lacunae TaxID=2801331 RepID=A0ABS1KST7_9BACT|nr:serine hydrolase [Chryseolinea lacunae]MBL0742258.1 serine hydrolase [Chryseolinea lacunae]